MGFFAEDRLASPARRTDQIGVGVCRRRDDHGVDRRIGERGVGISHLRAVFGRQALGRAGIDIDDIAEHTRRVAGHVGGVQRADPPGAELTDLDHRGPLSVARRARKSTLLASERFLLYQVAQAKPQKSRHAAGVVQRRDG